MAGTSDLQQQSFDEQEVLSKLASLEQHGALNLQAQHESNPGQEQEEGEEEEHRSLHLQKGGSSSAQPHPSSTASMRPVVGAVSPQPRASPHAPVSPPVVKAAAVPPRGLPASQSGAVPRDEVGRPITPIAREAQKMAGSGPTVNKAAPLEPWDRFDRSRATELAMPSGLGRQPFFDLSSSAERGRFRVHDARGFVPESMRRAPHPHCAGIVLLTGRRPTDHGAHPGAEQIITVMFDRAVFTEDAAEDWWRQNRDWATSAGPLGR